ncbi:MAG: helix-turn-helix transcriptional regulator [Burkholderiaceae bacterium]
MNIRESAGLSIDDAGEEAASSREPFLVALGERVRTLRARKGMTRRSLAIASAVSERHLANLELGVGNASILVLRQVASALDCTPADLLGDEIESPEWLLIRDLLRRRDDAQLRRARLALADLFGTAARPEARKQRIALIGLRGAGKSTLGKRLAGDMGVPFVELNREIERVAGYGLTEIHNLLGPAAYRRYERRALEEAMELHPDAVIATPGGIVSDPATFNLLLSNCYTVWLMAAPVDHMQRVVAQGDTRPMAGNTEAMEDLRRILAGRAAFYRKADLTFDTSGQSLDEAYVALTSALSKALGKPIDAGAGNMQ